ncbi:protein BLISTER [Vicia villosa]|uniref:protein BLISTER n=1 Tax=Vicia villosa TaxID=3911 RepID=UPI00273A8797|nr:protein BLISTER [Vicia villosa]
MASAQVLPNNSASSRKQEHLEAGKRRLEEFRKKKAAERVKKATSSGSVPNSDAGQNQKAQKQSSEVENVRINDSDGVTTSDGIGGAVIETGTSNQKNVNLFDQSSNQGSLAGATSLVRNDLDEERSDIDEAKRYNASTLITSDDVSQNSKANKTNDIYGIHTGGVGGIPHRTTTNHQSIFLRSQESQELDSSTSQSILHGVNESQSNKSDSSVKDFAVTDVSSYFPSKIIRENSVDSVQKTKQTNSSTFDSSYSHGSASGDFRDSISSMFRETNRSDSDLPSLHGATIPKYESSGYEARNSSNHTPIHSVSTESNSRKLRPSFLDSLNVTRPPTGSPFHQPEQDASKYSHLESSNNGASESTYFRKPPEETKTGGLFSNLTNAPVVNNNSDTMMISAKENGMERKHDYYSSSQNEDFSTLEQHIEDLTQEKFSLQRALEASQVLAESLATENSSLTDNYNHQRSIVNQLKSEMENLQQEIKAQLVELEAIRNEYTNVQLECNAADERAKLLASEVIGLEEKALRLRSNELKLEKRLETEQAEISSYRKKMSSLEKDRHDLQSTIDALQEEKKMLLSKVRKASGFGKSESKSSKRDGSTSTDDLVSEDPASSSSNTEINDNAAIHDAGTSSLSAVPETTHSSFGASSVNIPHDQMRMIENINALISELALEKEELIKSLAFESAESSRMKEINKELSRKLEVQTQRLELLTAQNMVNESIENVSTKQTDSRATYENIPYADEGDEVVERVLGWIMKLFPGGPSRRRTSKLL